jgi:hypothetical protein
MRRIFALALFLCAGCASSDPDVRDELFGDLGSFFTKHDTSSTSIAVPTPGSMGYSNNASSIASPPQAPPSQ